MVSKAMNDVAESVLLRLFARLAAALGVPVCLAIGAWVHTEFTAMRQQLVHIETLMVASVEPRLKALEDREVQMQAELRMRTTNRYDKEDARRDQDNVRRELDRIDLEMRALRAVLEKVEKSQ